MKYLLIPSCEVLPLDSLENTQTLERLQAGLLEWEKNAYDFIIVSGGIYLPPEIQTIPCAILMRNWLVENNVSEENIICETSSRDTYENIECSMKLILDDKYSKITVVSHWQHCLRFKTTFWRKYKKRIYVIPMWNMLSLKGFILEWIFLAIHIVDKNGTSRFVAKVRNDRTFD